MRTSTLSITNLAICGALFNCGLIQTVIEYVIQASTLALVLGIALKVSRIETEELWRDRGED